MWNPDGPLLQVEIGNAVSAASNEPDGRGLLAKMTGAPAPVPGKRIREATQGVRVRLLDEGVLLPPVEIRVDEALQPDAAVFYTGIERRAARLAYVDQVPLFIGQRASDLARPPLDRPTARTVLGEALSLVRADSYQDAFERYCRVYYQGVLADFSLEVTRALYDAAGIYLQNGDLPFTLALLARAHQISQTQAIVDAVLKVQVILALANVLRLMNRADEAVDCYRQAADGAYYCDNSLLLFLALTGAAEVKYQTAQYANSAGLLGSARELVSNIPADQPYQLAYHVERSINTVLTSMLTAARPDRNDLFAVLKRALITALVKSLVGAVVCKLFNTAGGLSLSLFGLANYNLQGSIFRGPTAIGDNPRQNM